MNEPAPRVPDELNGPLLTRSADMRIAVVFSKQQAAEAEAKISPALFLWVNVPKSALFRSVDECRQFFDEEAWAPAGGNSRVRSVE